MAQSHGSGGVPAVSACGDSAEMGLTLGPLLPCTLLALLHGQDPQAPRTRLRGPQVILGLPSHLCGELGLPLVSSNPIAKILGHLWVSQADEWPHFQNSPEWFKPWGVQGRLEQVP